jgi:putative ABC transport system permease protein
MSFTFFGLLHDGALYWLRHRVVFMVAVCTLAASAMLSILVFTAIDGVWFQAVPYREPNRIVSVNRRHREMNRTTAGARDLDVWRTLPNTFEHIGAFDSRNADVRSADGSAISVTCTWISPEVFAALQETPAIGRLFGDSEPHAAVLSDGFARTRFRDGAVGRVIEVDQVSLTVVGVLPAKLSEVIRGAVFLPLSPQTANSLQVVGRLRAGVSAESANAAADGALQSLKRTDPVRYDGWTANVRPLRESLVDPALGDSLWIVFAGVLLVQIAVAMNVSLLLALASDRDTARLSIQRMLGASSVRLTGEIVARVLSMSVATTGLALALSYWATTAAVAYLPPRIPRTAMISVGGRATMFAFIGSLCATLVISSLPIMRQVRFVSRGPFHVERGGRAPLIRALIAAQVALACIVIVAAVGFARGFASLTSVPIGFNPVGLVTFDVTAPGAAVFDWRKHEPVTRSALVELRSVGGIESFGAADMPPFAGARAMYSIELLDMPSMGESTPPMIDYRLITPGYFRTMQMTVVRGRDLSVKDDVGAPDVALVNETAVRRYWHGVDPVGKRILVSTTTTAPIEIVGVVNDVRHLGYDRDPVPEVYRSWLQEPRSRLTFVVRPAAQDTATWLRMISSSNRSFARNATLSRARTFSDIVDRTVAQQRFRSLLLEGFGTAVSITIAVGIVATTLTAIYSRRREVGVRLALGASFISLCFVFLRETLSASLLGVVAGTLFAAFATSTVATVTSEVNMGGWRECLLGASACVVICLLSACLGCLSLIGRRPAELLRRS